MTEPPGSRRARLSIGAEELETFLVVAELGSFSKAAERLSLAQPSVTNRVQRLERDLRTRLFDERPGRLPSPPTANACTLVWRR